MEKQIVMIHVNFDLLGSFIENVNFLGAGEVWFSYINFVWTKIEGAIKGGFRNW